jgi:predicted TIM-barrel fold metal-dependent hydrolase
MVNLSKMPQFYMKISQLPPNPKPMVRRVYDAFGPDRLIWGSYGSTMEAFSKTLAQIDDVFDFASETERAKIRGGKRDEALQIPGVRVFSCFENSLRRIPLVREL